MIAYHRGKAGDEFSLIGAGGCLTADNATQIIYAARDNPCDWLFFHDADVQYQGKDDVLGAMIAQNRDVLAGVYYQGHWPYRPVLYNFNNDGLIENYVDIPKEPVRVDAAGAGWLLMKKWVVDLFSDENITRLGEPFENTYRNNRALLKADAAFFWRLKQLGVEVWADPTIPLRHMKTASVGPDFWHATKSTMKQQAEGGL
jgi:hypothetical protein